MVLSFAPQCFSLGALVFPSPQKLKFQKQCSPKTMHHRGALFQGQGGGGGGVQDMTLPLMGNLGAKGTSLILANLQAVAGGKKCCFRREILPVTPDKENTAEVTEVLLSL